MLWTVRGDHAGSPAWVARRSGCGRGSFAEPCPEGGHHLGHRADARMDSGVRGIVPGHQAGEGDVPPPQGVQRFEAFEEPLPRAERFDAAGGAEPAAGEDVTTLDRLRRLAMRAVQPRADMRGLGQYLLDGLDVGLVMIGTHLRRLPALRASACRKKALADSVSRCSRNRTSTTCPCSSTAL